MPIPKPNAMIFDLDGTLFQTETVLDHAYEQTFQQLREKGLFSGPTPPVDKMYQSLGMIMEDIWVNLVPGIREETRGLADEIFLANELAAIRAEYGKLYSGVRETLRILAQHGIRIFVASNGLEPYVKDVIAHTGLESYIEYAYCAGEFATRSKSDLVHIVMQEQKLSLSCWMVGDRSSDIQAGIDNGLVTVGCDYAHFKSKGELEQADIIISTFTELLEYV